MLKILYYTRFFRGLLSEVDGFVPALAADWCDVLTDPARLPEADAVVFHLPDLLSTRLPPKRSGQIWVGLSMESNANYPLQADEAYMRPFDIRMNFRQDCDIPLAYFKPDILPLLKQPLKWKWRRAPAVCFVSNLRDHNRRREWITGLRSHLRVDWYGKAAECRRPHFDDGPFTKLRVTSRYLFSLAFENSNETDYVTEKLFEALIAGTVPIYLGAPNIEEFLPGRKCLIKADDFSGPAELAAYLLELKADPRRYREYLEWKQHPFSDNFLRLVHQQAEPPLRRLCRKLAVLKAS